MASPSENAAAPPEDPQAPPPPNPSGEAAGEGAEGEEEEPQTLERAQELFDRGSKAIEVEDFVDAVDCLSRALEIRTAHYGELAPECASTYFKYGCALLYKAQEETPLGNVPKSEPNEESVKSTTAKADSECSKASGSNAEDAVSSEKVGAEEGESSNGKDHGNRIGEIDKDDDDDDDDEKMEDEEDSDLDLSWKMLDIARAIAEKSPDNTMEKVKIYSALGEVALEREDIDNSLSDYKKALAMVEQLVEPDHHRIVELNFRICLVYELESKIGEAIPHCAKAISLCKSRIQSLKDSKDASLAGKDGESAAEEGLEKSAPEAKIEHFTGILTELEKKLEDLEQAMSNPNPAAKISEMMHSSSLDNAPTQTLLRVVNDILDECIERKREIPHGVVYLLRNVVQVIQNHIGIQADHVRNQNIIIKTREDKYRSKIKALERLVNGASEENEVEKSRIDEKRKLGEQDLLRLMQEKDNAENTIASLQQEIQTLSRMHDQYREQKETEARQMKERIKEAMDNQKVSIKDIRLSSQLIKQEMVALQMKWKDEICNIGHDINGLVHAADNYHKVLAENQKMFNELQELKGNIKVYCRVRPFLPGQPEKTTTVDYIGENGEIFIKNPFKQGKDGRRMFKFNKVFNIHASQAEIFSEIQPLIRSVIDGYNLCIFAYGQTGSGKTYTMSGPGLSKEDWGVNYRALNDLFEICLSRRSAFSYEVEIQMVEIYNEQVRDLLSNNTSQKSLGIQNSSQPNGVVVPDARLHQVKSTSDILDLMEMGQTNRAVGSTALNERSSRSHSILTVHVRGLDLKNGSTSRGCLHLIDLAGSERVERSGATGDRLKEAQYINKSLSALGDVIFALAHKNAHIPYRNSKLTQVLQSSLGGKAKTLMFVLINPDTESYSETMSTLNFAERVSGVELGPARSNKEGKDIKELQEQVSYLTDKISQKDMEIEQLLKDKSKSRSSSTDINGSSQQIRRLSGAAGSGEAECEYNMSDDGCSVARAEYSVAGASVAKSEQMQKKAQSKTARLPGLTKNGQPGNSESKPLESALKPPGRTKSTGSHVIGGSLVKPPQKVVKR